MPTTVYRWSAITEFRDRVDELKFLGRWWSSARREPVNLYGRRRVGKSWLFRKFAHGKPAVILVADSTLPAQQFARFAGELEPVLGLRPQIDSVATLFRILYSSLPATRKTLVVVDEFPYLLGASNAERQANLTAIQAVLEQYRDDSTIKLVLAGSQIGQMEALQQERSPLHGRLVPLNLLPLPFADARLLIDSDDSLEQLTRYAIAGGMPRYLAELGRGPLPSTVADAVLDRRGGLFNEPITLLQTELREPAVYFSILSALAGGPQGVADIADAVGLGSRDLTSYLQTLEDLRLAARHAPVGSPPGHRRYQWRCADHFLRFWFRFVHPYRADLEAGADARAHMRLVVTPQLADHTAPAFEEVVLDWTRRTYAGRASSAGAWWGSALHAQRRAKARFTEEIDAVAVHGRKVVAVAEAKWTNRALDAKVLTDLRDFKLPAMAQAGFDVSGAEFVLVSRSGITRAARDLAASIGNVTTLDAIDVLA